MIYEEEETGLNPYITVLSYPRCGSNFLYFALYSIMGVRYDKQHAASGGYWDDMYEMNGWLCSLHTFPMILIVRDPLECIPRQTGEYHFGEKFIDALSNKIPTGRAVEQHHYDYIKLIDHYDKATQPKIMVYYEDLLTNPGVEIKRVLDHLRGLKTDWAFKLKPTDPETQPFQIEDYDEERYRYFIDNYEDMKKKSLSRYGTITSASETRGEDLHYHSKKMAQEDIDAVKNYITETYPDLAEKYLKRYLR